MATRHLLLLDTHGLTIWRAGARTLDPVGHFSSGSDGPPAFAEWLASRADATRLTLVVDLPEEAYALERLPRARGRDRAALLQRRLAQHGLGSPYGAALSLGPTAEAPRREQVLLCALPHPEPLARWLTVLAEKQASLTGVHLVALILDSLVSRLARHRTELQGRFLLVSEHAGGTRHSFFEHGRLCYSKRLASADPGAVQRTHAYLYAHDLIEHGANLRVVDLGAHASTAPGVPASPVAAAVEYQALDPRSLCSRLGIGCVGPADATLRLILHQAVRARNLPHCAPAATRRIDRLHRLGHRIGTAGFAIGVGAALFAAWLAAGNQQHAAQIDELAAAAARQQTRHDDLFASLPPLPAPPEALGKVLDSLTQQAAQDADPQHLLHVLGDALDAHPALALRTLTWGRAPAPGDAATGPITLTVALELPPPTSSPPQAQAALRSSFVAHLARHTDIRTVLRPPPSAQHRDHLPRHQSGPSSGGLHVELQALRQDREPS